MFPILLYNNVMREIIFKIDDKNSGLMIRDFLRNFGVSSALLTKLKQDENGIKLNGKFAKAIEVLKSGDNLTVNIKNSGKMPEKFECENVKVAYNDEDILVLNKPPLMPVHESRNHRGDTLANVAACYMESDCAFRAVYRLDRDTSGLVLIAKNELAASANAESGEQPPLEALVREIVDDPRLPIACTDEIGHGADARALEIGGDITLRAPGA